MTSKYDPTDPQHQSIKLGIEEGDGIPNLSTIEMCVKALRSVGFEVLENRDLASEGDAPWYTPLDNSWSLRNFRNTRTGRWFTSKFVSALEMLRIAPRGTGKTHDFLIKVYYIMSAQSMSLSYVTQPCHISCFLLFSAVYVLGGRESGGRWTARDFYTHVFLCRSQTRIEIYYIIFFADCVYPLVRHLMQKL